MINPYAAFDSLYISEALRKNIQHPVVAELHVFAYLACLLSLYRGQPVAEWGYGFAGTRGGSPFSHELDSAVRTLIALGFLSVSEGNVRITERGQSELSVLRQFHQNKERIDCLEPATSSALTMPVGVIRHALAQEPTLMPSSQLLTTRTLLDGPYMPRLYEQFAALGRTVGIEHEDLLIPATVWLGYLWRVSEMLNGGIATGVVESMEK
ncbi:hypothetical protein [Paludibaculum fermentans]|uniref:hypothetical protein n=1 Tax=Paludibaculum fermentans TaxID=1473598 RepID=UPI003EBAC6A0